MMGWVKFLDGPFAGKIEKHDDWRQFLEFGFTPSLRRPVYEGEVIPSEERLSVKVVRYRYVGMSLDSTSEFLVRLFSIVDDKPYEELQLSNFDKRLFHQCKISSE